jgi:hypothetical protein
LRSAANAALIRGGSSAADPALVRRHRSRTTDAALVYRTSTGTADAIRIKTTTTDAIVCRSRAGPDEASEQNGGSPEYRSLTPHRHFL